MPMKLIEAHRKMDTGIPLDDSEMKDAEQSLWWFYGIVGAFGLFFAAVISILGWTDTHERTTRLAEHCKSIGMEVETTWFASRCAPKPPA